MIGLSGARMWRTDLQVVVPGRIKDPYNPSRWEDDWDNVTLTPIPACTLQPQTTREIRDGASRVIIQTGWRLITRSPEQFAPASNHRIRVPGIKHDLLIVGDPEQWDGVQPHTELALEDING